MSPPTSLGQTTTSTGTSITNSGLNRSRPRVAIVDDDDEIRSLLAKFLSINNYEISTAKNTSDLHLLLKTLEFDIIILDIMLPKESGITYLINNRANLKMPVVILTAMGPADDRINSLAIGADEYISKPFEPRELLSRLNALVTQRKTRL